MIRATPAPPLPATADAVTWRFGGEHLDLPELPTRLIHHRVDGSAGLPSAGDGVVDDGCGQCRLVRRKG